MTDIKMSDVFGSAVLESDVALNLNFNANDCFTKRRRKYVAVAVRAYDKNQEVISLLEAHNLQLLEDITERDAYIDDILEDKGGCDEQSL